MRVIDIDVVRSFASSVAGQAVYSLPSDLHALLGVYLNGERLSRIPLEDGDSLPGDGVLGKPAFFATGDIHNMPAIRVYPTPLENGTNDIEVLYERSPTVVQDV